MDAHKAEAVSPPCKDGGWEDTATSQEGPRTAGRPEKQRRAHKGFYLVSQGPPPCLHLDLRLLFQNGGTISVILSSPVWGTLLWCLPHPRKLIHAP